MPPVKKPWPRTLEEFVALERLCVGIITGREIPQTALAFDADAHQKARARSGVQLLNSTRKEWTSSSSTISTRKLSKADIHPYFHTLLEKAAKLLDRNNSKKQNIVDLREECLSSLGLSEADVCVETDSQVIATAHADRPASPRQPVSQYSLRPSVQASSKSHKRKLEELDDDRAGKSKNSGTRCAISRKSMQDAAKARRDRSPVMHNVSHVMGALASNSGFDFFAQDSLSSSVSSSEGKANRRARSLRPDTNRDPVRAQNTGSAEESSMSVPPVPRYNPELICPTPSRFPGARLGPQCSYPPETPEYLAPHISMSSYLQHGASNLEADTYNSWSSEARHVFDEYRVGVPKGVDRAGCASGDGYNTVAEPETETLSSGFPYDFLMQFGPLPPMADTNDEGFASQGEGLETALQPTVPQAQAQALLGLGSGFTETFGHAGFAASEQFSALMPTETHPTVSDDAPQYESNVYEISKW